MTGSPFISIVIPVYNVERYLVKAVESVLTQTFQNFEMILVDDCSPDNCPEICDEYAKQDERIKVIHHKANRGLSMARNSGMKIAAGKYIWFMDSDDYVENYLLQKVYDSLMRNPAEIVVFGLVEDYYTEGDQLHHSKVIIPEAKEFKSSTEVRSYIIKLEHQTLYGYAWNKIYDNAYLQKINLRYEKVTLIEDILFNVKYCMDIESMNVLPISCYHYGKRKDNSLTSKYVPDYYKLHRKRIDLIFQQYNNWNMCTSEVKSILGALYTRYIFSALQQHCDKRAGKNHGWRLQWAERLKQESLFRELIPYAKSKGTLLSIMIKCLQIGNTRGIIILGRFIYICKNRLPMVFSILKQKR